MGDIVVIIIGIIVGVIIVFLICREIVCWYWKINKMVELMEEQNEYLKKYIGKQNKLLMKIMKNDESNLDNNEEHENKYNIRKCLECGQMYDPSNNIECPNCGSVDIN